MVKHLSQESSSRNSPTSSTNKNCVLRVASDLCVSSLAGGALGGCAAAILMRDKFVSAAEIISNMSDNQKDELITAVQRALSDIEVMDIVEMLALLCGDIHVKKRIIRAIIDYFHSQMRLEIID